METSPTRGAPTVDPYVLEFIVNMRWLLRYSAQQLDPTVEQRYPATIAQLAKLDATLSQIVFDSGCTLAELPFGAVRVAREAVLYLLVSDHLLGGCPPTMHPFLQRTCASAPRVDGGAPSSRRSSAHPDLNVSLTDDAEDEAVMDARPLCTIDPRGDEPGVVTHVHAHDREAQATLLLLRWLFSEGVLSEEELVATVETEEYAGGGGGVSAARAGAAATEPERFDQHQQLAQRLASMVPFYLGAHLLVTRSLLLQYCATLLTVEAVMHHVTHLRSATAAPLSHHTVTPPPCSVEAALLEWFQAVMDVTTASDSSAAPAGDLLRQCPALHSFAQRGPFCRDVADPTERDFFRLVQSGECVCVALLFYAPDAVPLADLATAIAAAERRAHADADSGAWLEQLHRQQSHCYWSAAIAAARRLGVSVLLTAEEVVSHGRTALPLQLFRVVQQLFAVLATNAEEDVRVSADTAWWEQMSSRDGLTALTGAGAYERHHDATAGSSLRSSTHLPGAQLALRRSMQGAFPSPPVVGVGDSRSTDASPTHRPCSPVQSQTVTAMQDTVNEDDAGCPCRPTDAGAAPAPTADGADMREQRQQQRQQQQRQSEEEGQEKKIIAAQRPVEGSATQRGARGGGDAEGGPTLSGSTHADTTETATSVLRPMVRRGGRHAQARTTGAPSSAATGVISTDADAGGSVTSASHPPRHAVDTRAAVLGEHMVDTYVRAEESDLTASRLAPVAEVTSPTDTEVLLHSRTVDAVLASGAHSRPSVAEPPTRTSPAGDAQAAVAEEAAPSAASAVESRRDDAAPAPVEAVPSADTTDGVAVPPEAPAHTSESSTSSSMTHSSDFVVCAATCSDAAVVVEQPRESGPCTPVGDFPSERNDSPSPPRRITTAGAAGAAVQQVLVASSVVSGAVIPAVRRFVSLEDERESEEDALEDSAAVMVGSGSAASSSLSSSAPASAARSVSTSARDTSAALRSTVSAAAAAAAASSTSSSSSSSISAPTTGSAQLHGCARSGALGGEAEDSGPVSPPAQVPDGVKQTATDSDEESPPLPFTSVPRSRTNPSTTAVAAPGTPAASAPLHRTPPRGDSDGQCNPPVAQRSGARLMPTGILSPSPVYPGPGRGTASRCDSAAASESLVYSGFSVPRGLELSISDVYGTELDSLPAAEGTTASDVEYLRRRRRTAAEESWFSSASAPRRGTPRSTVGSAVSGGSSAHGEAQVRELLCRLCELSMSDAEQMDKQELVHVLAEQQAMVMELTTVLRPRHPRSIRRQSSFSPSRQQTRQRLRQVHLRSPQHDAHGLTRQTPGQGQAHAAERDGGDDAAVDDEDARRSSFSAVTAESGVSAAHTAQSDWVGQLADTDVSSHVTDSLLFPTRMSTPRSP
ncbi:hypothetical protein NESM_000111600 [Novymonas esmeraldas]|uniref:Uncharacterized protein n=1 Tax=Novymonas esmeraldas TaxID=1808958 RepID=A0AAW0F337_9TRYP